jgi:hypothetical protein
MKKKIAAIILSSSLFGFHLFGDELAANSFSILKKSPNHIYFGPEIFALNLNTHFKNVRVHGTKFFLGLRLGYEYLKPEAFYFGIDVLSAGANHGFHESFKGRQIPQSNDLTGFGFFELRFGYTLAPTKWLLTPFLCLGGYGFRSGSHHHHFDDGFSYFGGGIHSRYEISQIFNAGLNFKIFGSFDTDEKFRFLGIKKSNHHGQWGGEIGLPLIWYVGSHKRWDIQLEPYFLKLDFSEVQNIYGLRLLFGYHF